MKYIAVSLMKELSKNGNDDSERLEYGLLETTLFYFRTEASSYGSRRTPELLKDCVEQASPIFSQLSYPIVRHQ